MTGASGTASRSLVRVARLLLVGLTVWALPREARAFTPAEALAPMTVTLVRSDAADCGTSCGEWLAMTGKIVPGSATLLRAALGRLGQRTVPVLIDSPGGNVDEALLMGRMIRDRKLDVVVSGTALTDCRRGDQACVARLRAGQHPGYLAAGIAACASACILVLAAGSQRSVPPNSYVGVHQMIMHQTVRHVINTFRVMRRIVGGRAIEISRTLIATRPVSTTTVLSSAPETLYTKVDRYLLAMGIDETIMPLMRSTAPSSIHWMSPSELSATRVATEWTEAATLVARGVAPKPTLLANASVQTTMPLAVDGRFVSWSVTRDAVSNDGSGCTAMTARADLPELHLQASLRFGPASETLGDDATIDLRFSPLDGRAADLVTTVGSVEFRRYAEWSGFRIGGSAIRLKDGGFKTEVSAPQKADAVWTASVSPWIALGLTLASGKVIEAKFPIGVIREGIQQWLQPCSLPAKAIETTGRAAASDAPRISATSGSAYTNGGAR